MTKTLMNSGSEVNAMTQAYAKQIGPQICQINVRVQKIDGSSLETFGIVIISFEIVDKFRRARFFQVIFLLAKINIEVILRISFLTSRNMDI